MPIMGFTCQATLLRPLHRIIVGPAAFLYARRRNAKAA